MKKKILVTGSSGQLGQSLFRLSYTIQDRFEFIFANRNIFPLDNPEEMLGYLNSLRPDIIINCAAYTAVDKAESEQELAMRINALAPSVIATWCASSNCQLIHISTDYVFDGTSSVPLKENAPTNPINVYGLSKLAGEKAILQAAPDSIIIRTSWVYSAFGSNFVKTMLQLMQTKSEIQVVDDQIGAPTYAPDLAKVILEIIQFIFKINDLKSLAGFYHFSNKGRISWFEFAKTIAVKTKSTCRVHPIPTSAFPRPAKRPAFSLLDCSLITQVFQIQLIDWEDSLEDCLIDLGEYIA